MLVHPSTAILGCPEPIRVVVHALDPVVSRHGPTRAKPLRIKMLGVRVLLGAPSKPLKSASYEAPETGPSSSFGFPFPPLAIDAGIRTGGTHPGSPGIPSIRTRERPPGSPLLCRSTGSCRAPVRLARGVGRLSIRVRVDARSARDRLRTWEAKDAPDLTSLLFEGVRVQTARVRARLGPGLRAVASHPAPRDPRPALRRRVGLRGSVQGCRATS